MKEPFEYRGYHILCFHEKKDHGNLFHSWAKAYVFDQNGRIEEIAIREETRIYRMAAWANFKTISDDEIWDKLELRTIAKIKARIDFKMFDPGSDYVETLSHQQTQDSMKPEISITDREIEFDILSALKKNRMSNSSKYEYDTLGILGYSYLRQLDLKRIEFVVGLLIEKKIVQHNKIEQTGIAEGGFYITALGLNYLEELQRSSKPSVYTTSQGDILQDAVHSYEYHVALSFAGEDRDYVGYIAGCISQAGFNVFYDKYEEVNLWGKDLYQSFHEAYSKRARYCVIFVSEHYAKKTWTRHELKSAQERALHECAAYILPVRFDETELPGLLKTTYYFDARTRSKDELVKFILSKLTDHQ